VIAKAKIDYPLQNILNHAAFTPDPFGRFREEDELRWLSYRRLTPV
jgi:hypothetical protein